MDDERSNSPSSIASSYDESDSKPTHVYQPNFNPLWFSHVPAIHSIRSITPVVRHDFRSIDALLSPLPTLPLKNDDTGYNSQLSASMQSHENDEEMENLRPVTSSTPYTKKNSRSKKNRTAFTDDQKLSLDRFYSTNRYPDPTQMAGLSHLLSLGEKVIRVWFQNKRSREKTH